jgi:WD40 repeat protein
LSAAISPDGSRVVTGTEQGNIRLWDANTGEALWAFASHREGVSAVAFSPDGRQVLSSGADGVVRVRDVESGEESLQLLGHRDAVSSAEFAPDGKQILTASGRARLHPIEWRPYVRMACDILSRNKMPEYDDVRTTCERAK